jgi:hypothetical protein
MIQLGGKLYAAVSLIFRSFVCETSYSNLSAQRFFKKLGKKHLHFFWTSIYAWNVGGRWYTSEPGVVTIDV